MASYNNNNKNTNNDDNNNNNSDINNNNNVKNDISENQGYSSPSSSSDNDSDSNDHQEEFGYPVEFIDGSFQCTICKWTIRKFTELPCGHVGCKNCIERWEKMTV